MQGMRKADEDQSAAGARLVRVLAAASIAWYIARSIHLIAAGSEPFWGNDEPRHILTSVFWYDFLRIMPLTDAVGFAKAYYGHYPAIAVLHWPPLTHWIIGFVFLITGPSIAAARLVILFFAVGALLGTYLLGRRHLGEAAAALAMVLLAGAKGLADYASVVMLEMPLLFWVSLAIWSLGSYTATSRARFAWLTSIFAAAALMTKQHAVLLVPTLAAGSVLSFKRRHWTNPHLWVSALVFLVPPFSFYFFSLTHITSFWQDIRVASGAIRPQLLEAFFQIGPHTVVLAAAGFALAVVSRSRNWLLWVCFVWAASVFTLYTTMGVKSPRYLLYSYPALALVAGWFLYQCGLRVSFGARVAVAGALAVLGCYQSLWAPYETLLGYEEAARRATLASQTGRVFFGGIWDGPFVLYRRLADPPLNGVTFRASKVLGGGIILPERGYQGFVSSREDVLSKLADTGADVVVLEDKPEIDRPEHRWFWDSVSGREFELFDIVPVTYPNGGRGTLRLFRYTAARRNVGALEIPMLTLKSGRLRFDPARPLIDWGRSGARQELSR